MKLTLSLTHRCNLACRYCYAGRSDKPDMPLPTAKRSIDEALRTLRVGEKLELALFGGEPLLRFDLVREITDYAEKCTSAAGVSLSVGITTNGTLVSPAVLDYVGEHGISLCFSLDGPPEVHDRNRLFQNGLGSFAQVRHGLEQALVRPGLVEVNAVFGPETLSELPRTFRFLTGLGVRAIHFSPDITAIWTPGTHSRFAAIYMEIAEHYLDCFRRGIELALNLFDSKALLFIRGGYVSSDRCSMGGREWAVAPSGNLYPCERFIGDDDNPNFRLGNIHTGFQQTRCSSMRARQGNHRVECLGCRQKDYCMSWCACTNYHLSGRSDMPAPVLCAMEKAAIGAAQYVFESLVNGDNECYVDHMFHYLNAESHRFGVNRDPISIGLG
ncbi:MAG: radical SAM protein [Candidatus Thiodiazotropha sp.]